jgi:hypothetical protein
VRRAPFLRRDRQTSPTTQTTPVPGASAPKHRRQTLSSSARNGSYPSTCPSWPSTPLYSLSVQYGGGQHQVDAARPQVVHLACVPTVQVVGGGDTPDGLLERALDWFL